MAPHYTYAGKDIIGIGISGNEGEAARIAVATDAAFCPLITEALNGTAADSQIREIADCLPESFRVRLISERLADVIADLVADYECLIDRDLDRIDCA